MKERKNTFKHIPLIFKRNISRKMVTLFFEALLDLIKIVRKNYLTYARLILIKENINE